MKRLSISTLFLSLGVAVAFGQPPTIGSCTIFPANNIWNTPIDTLPVSPDSATYVNTIGASLPLHPDFGSGTYLSVPMGIPFVVVPGTQTRYPATFTWPDESDPGPYGIPLNAPIEGGSTSGGDRHAIALDADNCILYELYRAFPQTNSSWIADSGAIFNLKSNALRPAGWTSADAAGFAIMPGLARYQEVLSGEIRHALRFTVPQTRHAYVWPARHYASTVYGTQYPPMGQRFRLKATFDISAYPADMQVILRALKKYGMMIADNGSSWYISGDNDPGWNNDHLNLLKNLKGSDFEAVDATVLMVDPNSGQAIQPGVSVTITPSSASLLTGATQQFTAVVQNSADQSVNWSVNGMPGGSSAVGFITTTGLYTAPALVPLGDVAVQATSVVFPSATMAAPIAVHYPAPVISAVTPNPITAGSFNLNVSGSNFQSGSVVKLGGVSVNTSFSSSSLLTASGSISTLGSVSVTVLNPDGQLSAAYNIWVNSSLPVAVTVSPASATVRVRRTAQFTATVQNTADTRVTWQVNGITGGNGTLGTISTTGLYTAPGNPPSPATVTVRAVSVADASKSGSAAVTITRK